MSSRTFDHSRMESSLYQNLETRRGATGFLLLVVDYVQYLRSMERGDDIRRDEQDLVTAKKFVEMVDTDHAWAMARLAFREVQMESQSRASLPVPLRYVMDKLQPRLSPANIPRNSQVEHYVDQLSWKKMMDLAKMHAICAHGGQETEEGLQEVKEFMNNIENAEKLYCQDSQDKDAGGEESEGTNGENRKTKSAKETAWSAIRSGLWG